MSTPSPTYGWYGDDFTGATDTLSTLVEGGLRALLFLDIPTAEQLASAGPLDAIGIAGATRAMAPEALTAELDRAGRFLAAQGVALMHYKCCSTFDSSPATGSLGAAIRALRPHFPQGPVPVIGGQPSLGRYCLFGNLFAAAGSGGAMHRIDRHPTMSIHPVTPMREADLRLHLQDQGLGPIELLEYREYDRDIEALWSRLAGKDPDAILLDVARHDDLAVIGQVLLRLAMTRPTLAVGASSVAQAFLSGLARRPGLKSGNAATKPATARTPRGGFALALAGSLSPVTRAQVEAATGYVKIVIDPARLLGDAGFRDELCENVVARLAREDVMLITDQPRGLPENAGRVAEATAELLHSVVERSSLSRLIVAGGDTSSRAIKALDIWGISYQSACVPGAALCRAHSAIPDLDGLEIILKGGQIGPPDFFDVSARR